MKRGAAARVSVAAARAPDFGDASKAKCKLLCRCPLQGSFLAESITMIDPERG